MKYNIVYEVIDIEIKYDSIMELIKNTNKIIIPTV